MIIINLLEIHIRDNARKGPAKTIIQSHAAAAADGHVIISPCIGAAVRVKIHLTSVRAG